MAHIVSFKIEGLAGRKDVYKQRLNRDVNVFFGLNGSGKTSLLRILDSAMDDDASKIKMVPFKSAEVTIYSINLGDEFTRKISRREEGEAVTGSFVVSPRAIPTYQESTEGVYFRYARDEEQLVWVTEYPSPAELHGGYAHIYLPTWRLYGGTQTSSFPRPRLNPRDIEREYDWDKYFGEQLESLWKTYSNKLLSEVRRIQEEGLASILRGIVRTKKVTKTSKTSDLKKTYKRVSAFLERQRSASTLGSLRKFERNYDSDTLFAGVVSHIDTIEMGIEKVTSSRYELEGLIRNMFSGNKSILFKDTGIDVKTDDGQDIGLASLSSGEKHVLDIFIDTLLCEANSLLIDEPEISLHVDWQKELIASMCQLNPATQLILATHSPEIIAKVPDNKIFPL